MRALFAGALVIAVSVGRADGQSGTISYASGVSLDVEMPGELAEVPAVLEAWGSAPFLLHFTPSQSLMVQGEWNRGRGVAPARFRATGTNLNALGRALEAWYAVAPSILSQAYVGEEGSSGVKLLTVSRAQFRIAGGGTPVGWTITEQYGEHLGYEVTRAVGEAAGQRVEAWFAPDIPVSFGPALYGGLPGMILALSVNEGVTTYTATEVVLGVVEDGLIRGPEDGEGDIVGRVPVLLELRCHTDHIHISRYDSPVPESGMYGRMAERCPAAVPTVPGGLIAVGLQI